MSSQESASAASPTWRQRARRLKIEVYTLYLAYRNPRTPWYAKLWAAVVVGYAFSPIDFIPDFLPLLGYLDDLILLPLGVLLALKLIPDEVAAESRAQAEALIREGRRITSRAGGVVILVLWLLLVVLALRWAGHIFRR
ncbi:MAG: YkvA family protein [Betaproteobacteria bacterium]